MRNRICCLLLFFVIVLILSAQEESKVQLALSENFITWLSQDDKILRTEELPYPSIFNIQLQIRDNLEIKATKRLKIKLLHGMKQQSAGKTENINIDVDIVPSQLDGYFDVQQIQIRDIADEKLLKIVQKLIAYLITDTTFSNQNINLMNGYRHLYFKEPIFGNTFCLIPNHIGISKRIKQDQTEKLVASIHGHIWQILLSKSNEDIECTMNEYPIKLNLLFTRDDKCEKINFDDIDKMDEQFGIDQSTCKAFFDQFFKNPISFNIRDESLQKRLGVATLKIDVIEQEGKGYLVAYDKNIFCQSALLNTPHILVFINSTFFHDIFASLQPSSALFYIFPIVTPVNFDPNWIDPKKKIINFAVNQKTIQIPYSSIEDLNALQQILNSKGLSFNIDWYKQTQKNQIPTNIEGDVLIFFEKTLCLIKITNIKIPCTLGYDTEKKYFNFNISQEPNIGLVLYPEKAVLNKNKAKVIAFWNGFLQLAEFSLQEYKVFIQEELRMLLIRGHGEQRLVDYQTTLLPYQFQNNISGILISIFIE